MELKRGAVLLLAGLLVVASALGWAPPATAAPLTTAADSFTRTTASALGSADSGGAWTLVGTASKFTVAGGVGRLSLGAGSQLSAYLASTSIRDTDVVATVATATLPVGGSLYTGLVARHAGATEYGGRVLVAANGAVTLNLMAGATSLRSVAVAGLTATAGSGLRLRLQANGASPTTVRARVWKVGTAEPATWQITTTDSTPGLQSAGSVGIRGYLSSSAGGSTVATFDDLSAGSSVPNTPPVASFTAVPTGLSVGFDASASTDAEGPIAADAWDFGDGQTGTGPIPTHVYAAAGLYPVVLTVTDAAGATATTTRSVTVAVPNNPPTAAFTTTSTGLVLIADATASADPDGTVATFAWDFGDATNGTGAATSHTYAAAGTYVVTLTVTDDRGATAATTRTATVAPVSTSAPVATFTPTMVGLALSVDATASSDVGGTITGYAWTFGDGATATGATASHTYMTPGTYPVTLVVMDDQGASATTQQTVTVVVPNQPPVPTLLEQSNGLTATFWGDRSVDVDGRIVGYAWTFGDGTTSTLAAVSHPYSAPGTYTATLTVTDDGGASATISRAVSVYPAGTRPTQAQWLSDLGASLDGATAVIDAGATAPRPAVVLDIDNTSLQSTYQPFAAIPTVLALEQRAIAAGYTILFATGRTADAGGTVNQLRSAGYRIDALCFRDPAAASIQASKTACRAAWTSQGYTIVANIGNHTTDLDGGSSGRQYLLPNYNFLD